MKDELQSRQMARFALNASYQDIGEANIAQLKRHLLDALASLIHATTKPTIHKMVRQLQRISSAGDCRVPLMKNIPVDRAAQLYTALIRYPDFMDNYLGKEATCHPSDNIGALLAAGQLMNSSGKDFLLAMALGYQIECRLVDEIPVMIEGIDHTLLLAYSITAALSRMFGLSEEQAANALAISGCFINPLVSSRASYTSEWKGFVSSFVALNCMDFVMLAQEGVTGPVALFEGPKGFKEIFDMTLDYDWEKENFELIRKCILKSYNAEVHTQPSLEGILELKKQHGFDVSEIKSIHISTFLTAYHIVGSGAYGDRKIVRSKEQADHSLHYLAAVALLDGDVYPEQLLPERITRHDVQQLLEKVEVETKFPLHKPVKLAGLLDPYTEAYPDKVKTKVEITLNDKRKLAVEKEDYHGFFTRPFTWEDTVAKFNRLTKDIIPKSRAEEIIAVVEDMENRQLSDLVALLCMESDNSLS